ncbi:flagellar associated protein [Biscogniauxia marginata]|nr:flagellar associated protein [Biscogniauxia marginata]
MPNSASLPTDTTSTTPTSSCFSTSSSYLLIRNLKYSALYLRNTPTRRDKTMPEKKSKPPPDESITYSSGAHEGPPDLRFLHYNDVYHVDSSSSEPVGGAARFMSLVNHYREGDEFKGQPGLLTFFSGDAFNPSLESSITKGDHMVPLLNNIGTDAAALGNHDLDFGVRKFRHLSSKCKFPWLIANVLDPALGDSVPIGNCKKTHMITSSNGIKIGLIGLGEREWLATINSLPPDLIYRSASETARELVPQLRAEGAEIVIAITHMREPNDNKLAEQTDGIIDIILGGHDHYYNHSIIKGTHVLRSGTDFKQLSYLEARRRPDDSGRWDIDVTRRDVTSVIPQDEPTVKLVEKLTASLKSTLQKPIGFTAAPLDARFRTVRLKESNIANWVCDIMRHYYSGDCSLMASGTVRGDQIYPPGPVLLKDIMNCFPFEDPVVVIKVTGQAIWDALENGLSLYPALEGRFPQVSNIKFEFDGSKPTGSRIVSASVGGEPIDFARKYTLVTRGYMARGKDGYDSLLIEAEGGQAEEIVSEENGILISMMLRQYFMSLRVMGQWKYWGKNIGRHWDQVANKVGVDHTQYNPTPGPPPATPTTRTNLPGWDNWTPEKIRQRRASAMPIDESDSEDEEEASQESEDAQEIETIDKEMQIMQRVFTKWARLAGVECQVADELKAGDFEVDWTKAIAPRVEGRIVCVGGEHK